MGGKNDKSILFFLFCTVPHGTWYKAAQIDATDSSIQNEREGCTMIVAKKYLRKHQSIQFGMTGNITSLNTSLQARKPILTAQIKRWGQYGRKLNRVGLLVSKKTRGNLRLWAKRAVQLICLKCCMQLIAVSPCHGYEMAVHVRKMEIIIIWQVVILCIHMRMLLIIQTGTYIKSGILFSCTIKEVGERIFVEMLLICSNFFVTTGLCGHT